MANDEGNRRDSAFAEYESLVEDIHLSLTYAVAGYDLQLPLMQTFGAAWDLRIQLASVPAHGFSVSSSHEFFMVSLTRAGQPHFVKRCDSPPEVLMVLDDLVSGELEEVPASPEARLDVPENAKTYPVWLWGAVRGEPPRQFLDS